MEIIKQEVDTLQKIEKIMSRYQNAKRRRENWESHWEECYDYALPQRGHNTRFSVPGSQRMQNLYDGTAMDAVEQLSASLLGHLTPPMTQWFSLKPGPELTEQEAEKIAPVLEDIARKIQSHFDRSNFVVEMHQCFLDLAVGGTSTLYFEETDIGEYSAFKFSNVPLQDIVLEEGAKGFLDTSFRMLSLSLSEILSRYPDAELPHYLLKKGEEDTQEKFNVLESVVSSDAGYDFSAILIEDNNPILLKEGVFFKSPAISFRWMKSPGEIYGRSPVMKALPDIKTANKVVELILKNASIAVTGIWQADDDGVLNPANIELKPGAIIPKAVGSQGLKPLEMPGRFDVSELVLNDLRARIRHALLSDRLGQITDQKMSATEVLERSSEMSLLLGATYGRLQSELLTPLIERAFFILRRRGEIPDISLDGRYVALEYRSPLARMQGQGDAQNILTWLNSVSSMGAQASTSINVPKAVKILAESLGVPKDLIQQEVLTANLQDNIGGVNEISE